MSPSKSPAAGDSHEAGTVCLTARLLLTARITAIVRRCISIVTLLVPNVSGRQIGASNAISTARKRAIIQTAITLKLVAIITHFKKRIARGNVCSNNPIATNCRRTRIRALVGIDFIPIVARFIAFNPFDQVEPTNTIPAGRHHTKLLVHASVSTALPSSHASKPGSPGEARLVRVIPSPQNPTLQSFVHPSVSTPFPSSQDSYAGSVLSRLSAEFHRRNWQRHMHSYSRRHRMYCHRRMLHNLGREWSGPNAGPRHRRHSTGNYSSKHLGHSNSRHHMTHTRFAQPIDLFG